MLTIKNLAFGAKDFDVFGGFYLSCWSFCKKNLTNLSIMSSTICFFSQHFVDEKLKNINNVLKELLVLQSLLENPFSHHAMRSRKGVNV